MSFSKNSSSVVSSAFSAPASINRKARTKQPNSQTRQKKKKRKRKRNLDSGRCRLFDVLLFYYFIVTPLNGVYFLSGPTTRGYPSSFRPHPKNRYCSLSIKGRMVARLPSLDRSGKTISRFLPFFLQRQDIVWSYLFKVWYRVFLYWVSVLFSIFLLNSLRWGLFVKRNGFYRFLNEQWRVLIGSIGFHWIVLGFTGFNWV